jgi:hypothetical protein
VDEINAKAFEIRGRVEHLDVLECTRNRVKTLKRTALALGGNL